jgi:hypothetical protein
MHTITLDPMAPDPAAPWLVRPHDGPEWHAASREDAEVQLVEHLAARDLGTAEDALIAALLAYRETLPGCSRVTQLASQRRVQTAMEAHVPPACLPALTTGSIALLTSVV